MEPNIVKVNALALTNINATCDVWNFAEGCREAGIKHIQGVEVRDKDKLLYLLPAININQLLQLCVKNRLTDILYQLQTGKLIKSCKP